MNDNHFSQTLQQGFRVAIGAVTSIVETAQNPDKRTEALSELQMELNQKTREWAIKGETTEIEARKIIDNFLRQRNGERDSSNSESVNYQETPNNQNNTNVKSGLQQLRDELIALRIELAKQRESKQ